MKLNLPTTATLGLILFTGRQDTKIVKGPFRITFTVRLQQVKPVVLYLEKIGKVETKISLCVHCYFFRRQFTVIKKYSKGSIIDFIPAKPMRPGYNDYGAGGLLYKNSFTGGILVKCQGKLHIAGYQRYFSFMGTTQQTRYNN